MALNEQQKKFCEEYVKTGFNATEAYMAVYNTKSRKNASGLAARLLRNPEIVEEVKNVSNSFVIEGHRAGLTREVIVKVLTDIINNAKKVVTGGHELPDYGAKLNAIQLFTKLTGEFSENNKLEVSEKKPFEGADIENMSAKDRAKLEKQILEDLKRG